MKDWVLDSFVTCNVCKFDKDSARCKETIEKAGLTFDEDDAGCGQLEEED